MTSPGGLCVCGHAFTGHTWVGEDDTGSAGRCLKTGCGCTGFMSQDEIRREQLDAKILGAIVEGTILGRRG